MSQQFSNAARTELAAGILAGDTTFVLDDGQVFPDANNGDNPVGTGTWFKATLQDPDGIEIVYVRTHNSGTTPDEVSHVLRGQEGTVARAFAAGTAIGLRLTAGDIAQLRDRSTHTGTQPISSIAGLQGQLNNIGSVKLDLLHFEAEIVATQNGALGDSWIHTLTSISDSGVGIGDPLYLQIENRSSGVWVLATAFELFWPEIYVYDPATPAYTFSRYGAPGDTDPPMQVGCRLLRVLP